MKTYELQEAVKRFDDYVSTLYDGTVDKMQR